MKKHNNIFSEIYSFKSLHKAYMCARKGKRYKKDVLDFSYYLENNLFEIKNEIKNKSYNHGGYKKFIAVDAKKREVRVASFKDRVVHKAIYNTLEPIFNKGFIYDSYACRKNKGIYKAIKRLERFLQNPLNKYCLQCDISKYFKSIDHQILLSLIEKKIKDSDMLWLIKEIVDSYCDFKLPISIYERVGKTGIPIGNLTSQLFANIFLNELDQKVKHDFSQRYYIRYMDDFLILGENKSDLWQVLEKLEKFLKNELYLKLHPSKICLFPVEKGIDFLGYRIFKEYKLLRKSTVRRFLKRMGKYSKELKIGKKNKKEVLCSLKSWLAYAKHGNSWKLRKNLMEKIQKNIEVDLCKFDS